LDDFIYNSANYADDVASSTANAAKATASSVDDIDFKINNSFDEFARKI
jgi:hypothetical protein